MDYKRRRKRINSESRWNSYRATKRFVERNAIIDHGAVNVLENLKDACEKAEKYDNLVEQTNKKTEVVITGDSDAVSVLGGLAILTLSCFATRFVIELFTDIVEEVSEEISDLFD